MPQTTSLLITATLFAIMFALGLGLSGDTFRMLKHQPGLLGRLLVGTCVLFPLVALGLLKLPISQGLSEPTRFAIALMAVCPSAPLTLRKAGKKGGREQRSGRPPAGVRRGPGHPLDSPDGRALHPVLRH